MQGCIFDVGIQKSFTICGWYIFCIAINVFDFSAIQESKFPYTRHTIRDGDRG